MTSRDGLRRRGFTLLEVLAAVAVLGIVYVVVARAAIQGLQVEGDASRRLRASLLADRVLNDLELAMAAGSAPPVGRTEADEEDFAIVVEVTPFDVATLLESARLEAAATSAPSSPLALLAPSARGAAAPLLSIGVRVSWIEGVIEQEVTRTSFAFDREAVSTQLEAISQEQEAPLEEEAQ
jgi:prepilin-type N-terminal cleavage/methylation domain-containing protein